MVDFNLLSFLYILLILTFNYIFILMMLKTNTTDRIDVIVLERPHDHYQI